MGSLRTTQKNNNLRIVAQRVKPSFSQLQASRRHLDVLSKKIGIRTQEDWYKVDARKVKALGGKHILDNFNGSLITTLESVYSEYVWNSWQFSHVPKNFWGNKQNQRKYLDWLADTLHLNTTDDWTQVTSDTVFILCGRSLLSYYNDSITSALKHIYPEFAWNEVFHPVKAQIEYDKDTQRMNHLALTFNIQTQEQWYSLSIDVFKKRGERILKKYNTLCDALSTVYPQYDWHPWLFKHQPKDLWKHLPVQRQYFEWLFEQLQIEPSKAIEAVSAETVKAMHGAPLLSLYRGSLSHAFRSSFPELQSSQLDTTFIQLSHRLHLDWLFDKLKYVQQNDWYQLTAEQLQANGSEAVYKYYNSSLLNTLKSVYPEYEWYPWLFKDTPHSYWTSLNNQRLYCDWFAMEKGMQHYSQWIHVTRNQLMEAHGGVLLQLYNSIHNLLKTVYPEHDWSILSSLSYYRRALDACASALNIKQQYEWYAVTAESLRELGAAALVDRHNSSIYAILREVYPEYEWVPWLFPHTPKNFWTAEDNVKKYFEWLGEQLGISASTVDEWESRVSTRIINNTGGGSILSIYGSLRDALRAVYPHHLSTTSTAVTDTAAFSKTAFMRKYFDWCALQFGLEVQEDWYRVTGEDIKALVGTAVLQTFSNSIAKALQSVYPEYEWLPWRFQQAPQHFWDNKENQRRCMDWTANELGIEHMSEWVTVAVDSVRSAGAGGLIAHYGKSMKKVLEGVYPEYEWSTMFTVSDGQHHTWKLLKSVFKGEVLFNHKVWVPMLQRRMELDIYIPSANLAFEYQGEHHYSEEDKQLRDVRKQNICSTLGIALIQVPYWWNMSLYSLLSTIKVHRPDFVIPVHLQRHRRHLLSSH